MLKLVLVFCLGYLAIAIIIFLIILILELQGKRIFSTGSKNRWLNNHLVNSAVFGLCWLPLFLAFALAAAFWDEIDDD
jgi:hypothetical protein